LQGKCSNQADKFVMEFKNKIIPLLLMAALLPFVLSCSIEKKIAREYIKSDTARSVLLIPPAYLFKTSLKTYEIENAAELSEYELDSLLMENSLFLKHVSDSAFLGQYVNSFMKELEELGFAVYPDSALHSFLGGQANAFIINLAQLELEEYVMPLSEEEQFGDYIYSYKLDLNAVNLNSWIEINRINVEEDKEFFFGSLYLTDEMDGYFRLNYFTGDVVFRHTIDTLLLNEIYSLGSLGGQLHASYVFDHLLNKYIDKKMEEKNFRRSDIYYHYNRQKRYILPAAEGERLIPMN